MTMEKEMKTMWDVYKESPERMSEEQTFQKELVAGVEKQLAESKEIMRNMIGRMNNENIVELMELCADELRGRDSSPLLVFPRNVRGAVDAIEDAVKYLCKEHSFVAFVSIGATDESSVSGDTTCYIGTELEVATQLVCSMRKSESVKNTIIKVGTLMAEKWDDMMEVIGRDIEEEVEDE